MRILILNWRDIKHPQGGGAEILTHEIAKRWVAWGHEATQFSAAFPGGSKEEIIDGIKIIRRGTAKIPFLGLPVHIAAFFWYIAHGKGRFDIVIDEIHGIPFFTPLYVTEKKIALICEVAKEVWDANFIYPFNQIGRFVENNYFKLYKKIPFLTISPSTKSELIGMGIHNDDITVLPMGITLPSRMRQYPKEKNATIVFVGRISKAKGVEDAIRVADFLKSDFPRIKLWIIGKKQGAYYETLRKTVNKLKLQHTVVFFDFVSQEKKFELMSRAHLLISPSIKEGWGLIVPEAGYVSTPAVVYDVAGLRDLVEDGQNGAIVERKPEAMAKAIINLLSDPVKYSSFQKEARKKAKTYDWDKTAKKAMQFFTHQQ